MFGSLVRRRIEMNNNGSNMISRHILVLFHSYPSIVLELVSTESLLTSDPVEMATVDDAASQTSAPSPTLDSYMSVALD